MIPPVIGRYVEGLEAHDVDRGASTVADDLTFVPPTRTHDQGGVPGASTRPQ
jgi:hypothetical protein